MADTAQPSASIAAADLRLWQHASPAGSLVRSAWTPRADLRPGQVARINGAWRAITAVTADTQTGLTIAELSPADGEPGHALLTQHDGLETRTDMHVSIAEPELSGHPGPEYHQDSGTAGHLRCCQPEPEA
jgi:hypothetical protein